MAQVRMDIDQVRTFGNDLKGKYTQDLEAIKTQIQNGSNGLSWEGNDAVQFKGDKTSLVLQALEQLKMRFAELGDVAISNANAQESTSGSV